MATFHVSTDQLSETAAALGRAAAVLRPTGSQPDTAPLGFPQAQAALAEFAAAWDALGSELDRSVSLLAGAVDGSASAYAAAERASTATMQPR
jgi:hypothetical protein